MYIENSMLENLVVNEFNLMPNKTRIILGEAGAFILIQQNNPLIYTNCLEMQDSDFR